MSRRTILLSQKANRRSLFSRQSPTMVATTIIVAGATTTINVATTAMITDGMTATADGRRTIAKACRPQSRLTIIALITAFMAFSRVSFVKSEKGKVNRCLAAEAGLSAIFSKLLRNFGDDHTRFGERIAIDHCDAIWLEIHPLRHMKVPQRISR